MRSGVWCWMAVCAALCSCGGPGDSAQESGGRFAPIEKSAAIFWDRQTNETAALLDEIIADFNDEHDGLPLRVEHTGGYGDIYQKAIASIQAGTLPAMSVAYESMVVEYADRGAVVDLRPFFDDSLRGFAAEQRDDFLPSIVDACYYPEYSGAMLSFPFTKSVLVMYVNDTVLQEAGIDEPPATWEAFLAQCRQVKAETGKPALSFDIDPSTFNGFVFSMGGTLIADGVSQYGGAASVSVLRLLETLATEKLLIQNPPRTFNDQIAFGNDEIAFAFRPSSSIPYFEQTKGGREGWRVMPIPQADPASPGTVLYGANLTLFNTTPDQIETAWSFARFFARADVMARWCAGSGYVPFRRSAARHPALAETWAEWPSARVPFECLEFARAEPRVHGWQEIRAEIEHTLTAVVTGMQSADAAAASLKASADRILAERTAN